MKGVLLVVLYSVSASLLEVVISMFAAPTTAKVLTWLTPYVLIGDMGRGSLAMVYPRGHCPACGDLRSDSPRHPNALGSAGARSHGGRGMKLAF